MGRPTKRRAERNAGAFLAPDPGGLVPVPMRTLSDEYHDAPVEPQDSDRLPEPEPEGLVRRVLQRIAGRPRR